MPLTPKVKISTPLSCFFHLLPFIITLILLDQLLKYVAVTSFTPPIAIIPNFIHLTLEHNIGVAFSLPIPIWLTIPINLLLIFILPIAILRHFPPSHLLTKISLTLLLAGALGNLIDRLRLGYVIDFISVGTFPVFNLADSYVTISVFILLLFSGTISGSAKTKPKTKVS